MIQASYNLETKNQGLLTFLFPGWQILRSPFPPFISSEKVIVISDDRKRDFYPDKKVIIITRHAELKLDTKDGFIKYLRDMGVRISERQEANLLVLDDIDFWTRTKQALILGQISGSADEEKRTIFELFKCLFDPFEIVYPIYKGIGLHYKIIFSALLTMMLKTQQEQFFGMSPGYVKALKKNKTYYNWYKQAVLEYLDSKMEEVDFLAFLWDCGDRR